MGRKRTGQGKQVYIYVTKEIVGRSASGIKERRLYVG